MLLFATASLSYVLDRNNFACITDKLNLVCYQNSNFSFEISIDTAMGEIRFETYKLFEGLSNQITCYKFFLQLEHPGYSEGHRTNICLNLSTTLALSSHAYADLRSDLRPSRQS